MSALTPQSQSPVGSRATPAWIIAVLLAFIAGTLWSHGGWPQSPLALAQTAPMAGARGVYAFTGPIDRNQYGLFMLDVDQGTIWCYEFATENGVRKLNLMAARAWIYDRYLEQFNTEPDRDFIRNLVAEQRASAARQDSAADDGSKRTGNARPGDERAGGGN